MLHPVSMSLKLAKPECGVLSTVLAWTSLGFDILIYYNCSCPEQNDLKSPVCVLCKKLQLC